MSTRASTGTRKLMRVACQSLPRIQTWGVRVRRGAKAVTADIVSGISLFAGRGASFIGTPSASPPSQIDERGDGGCGRKWCQGPPRAQVLLGRTFIPSRGGLGVRRFLRCEEWWPWWPLRCWRRPNDDTTRRGCHMLRASIYKGCEGRIGRKRSRSTLAFL